MIMRGQVTLGRGDRKSPAGPLAVAAWGLTAAVFGMLWVCSVIATLDGRPTEWIRFGEAAFLSLSVWLLLLALARSAAVALALALPAVLLAPMEIWLRMQFGIPASSQFAALVLETTWSEVANFMVTYDGNRWAGWVAAWLLLYAVALTSAWRTRIRWQQCSRAWCLLILPAVLLMVYVGAGSPPWLTPKTSVDPFDGQISEGWSHQWEDVFPVNLAIALQRYKLERQKIQQTQRALQRQSLQGHLLDPASAPAVVVLVIGESATASRWGLLGYPRPTTPLLEQEANVLAFSDSVGLSNATRTAIPGALSRRPVLRPDGQVDSGAEPSFIKAFGEAGYQTHWYSNQAPFGKYDTSIAVYAREAMSVRFLNPSTYESRGNLDAVLFPPLEVALDAPGRHLIVLHTLGSHFDYSLRHPDAFDHFQPSRTRAMPDEPSVKVLTERTGNSYDNSVLYTDYFLSEVIQRLKRAQKSSVMLYFSDHGVDLPDGPCGYREATRSSESSYRVPLILWGSDSFRGSHPVQWEKLEANRPLPYTTRAVFATLLELAGVGISGGMPTDSLLTSGRPATRPRLVGVGDELVDFDAARLRDACFISAVANNKGLSQ